MDTRTYFNYTLEYALMREHYWIYQWLKAEMRLAESHRNHLSALRLITMSTMLVEGQIDTDPICGDMVKKAGTTAPGDICMDDLREVFDLVTAELEKAETTVREWHDPDIYGNRLDTSHRLQMRDFGADRLGLNIMVIPATNV